MERPKESTTSDCQMLYGRWQQVFNLNITAISPQPHLDSLQLTCLLSAPSSGQGAGPVPCSIEGCHADHVGGVARQVLQLHPELRQEQSAQALRLVLQLKLPEIDL